MRGRAVPLYDTELLARALLEILSSHKRPTSELHAYVAETFSAERIGGRYLSLFEDLRGAVRGQPSLSRPVAGEGAGSFGQLLRQYRVIRERERKSLRGRLDRLARAGRLFFADNRAFRRHLWSLLSERN